MSWKKSIVFVIINVILIYFYILCFAFDYPLLKNIMLGLCFGWALGDINKLIREW